MTDLRNEMYDAYTALYVDLDGLTTRARLEGDRLRRRRRRLVAAHSALVVLAVVGLGAWVMGTLAGGTTTLREALPAAGGTPAGVRLTGVDALTSALERVAPRGVVAEPSAMSYEPSRDGWPNAYGHLTFAPSPGAASAGVIVSYWPLKPGDSALHSACQGQVDQCRSTTLPDGSVVISYVASGPDVMPGAGAGRLVAVDRIVGDYVVTLAAGSPEVEPGTPSADPVLTRKQLVELIAQPEWERLVSLPPAA